SAYYSAATSSRVLTAADIEKAHYTDMKMLLMQIPGIMIIGDKITVRGGGAPLVVLDDVPDESFDPLLMVVSDISDIFLIKDASAGAMFGPKAGSGALIISTKRGFVQRNTTSHNINNLVELLGFQTPLEFYSPEYDASQRHTMTDLRTTIYWKPNVRVPETGEVSLDFYSADAETTYSVVMEGVSDHGHLIYKKAKIQRTEKVFRE
ncbi:MAG: TonB-dependent receptor plug domain-containing protein, partial [Tannerella sp.]|nr:TonB-dependent receptor plug domain-containing protein [Tannerella sp.]